MRRRRRWNARCAKVNWPHGALFFVMLLHFRTDLPPFGPGTRRTRMGRPSRIARDPRPNRCSEERPMTQIRSLAQPVHRRPGELGVHSLDLFNFLVPDAAAAEKFYRSFGRFESNGLWLRDADGTLLEIRVAEKSTPNEKSAVSNPPGAAAKANAPNRSKVP